MNRANQKGMTLIELLVAGVISIIVSSGMILLMASTLGTGSQTIQMMRLSQEMRVGMQLITRDLRRANYHNNAVNCFGNINCNPDATKIKVVTPVGGDCFRFWYDRESDGDLDVGTFQMVSVTRGGGSVNVLQMTTLDTATDTCGDDWGAGFDITDGSFVNISSFVVTDTASYCDNISATDSQTVSKIRITMTAELRNTPQGIPVSKTIEDLIFVRNQVFTPGSLCT